jgi:hypothetical protein
MKRLTYLSIVGWVACSWLLAGCGGSLTFLHDDDDTSTDDDDVADDDVSDDDVSDDDDDATTPCGEAAFFQDFESDDGGFSHDETNGDFDDPWELGEAQTQICTSGDQCWGTNLEGNYEDCNAGELLSPVVDLSACEGSSEDVTLRFWHTYWFETAGSGTLYDGGTIQLSADGGETWVTHSPEPGFTGAIDGNFDDCGGSSHDLYGQMGWGAYIPSGTWQEVVVELGDDLRVEEFRFRFLFGSDQGTTDDGWTIDDVEIRVE